MATRVGTPGEARLPINHEEAVRLLSRRDQAVNTRAVGILGCDTLYASAIGGIVGALTGAVILVSGFATDAPGAWIGIPAGIVGGAVGATVASIAHRIIFNGRSEFFKQAIPTALGTAIASLTLGNAIYWNYYQQLLPVALQLMAIPISGTALFFSSIITDYTVGFTVGLGTGSTIGLGIGLGIGYQFPAIGLSVGAIYGWCAGAAGCVGVFYHCARNRNE